MNPRYFLLISLIFLSLAANSQLYKVSGVVMDPRKDPLPLASVEIKETRKGTVTKDDGSYEFYLERGQYSLVVSMVGFKTKVINLFITNTDITENVDLEMEESANLLKK
jgi:hypothetical protein